MSGQGGPSERRTSSRGGRKGTRAEGREKGGSIRNEKHAWVIMIECGVQKGAPGSFADSKKARKNFGASRRGYVYMFSNSQQARGHDAHRV